VIWKCLYSTWDCDSAPLVQGLGASKGFELVDEQPSAAVPASCQPFKLRVKANAVTGPGPMLGTLQWSTSAKECTVTLSPRCSPWPSSDCSVR
jgi:hypothetical protein